MLRPGLVAWGGLLVAAGTFATGCSTGALLGEAADANRAVQGTAVETGPVVPPLWPCTGGRHTQNAGARSHAMTWVEVSPPADAVGLLVTGACAVAQDQVLFAASEDASVAQPAPRPPRILAWRAGTWTTELVMDSSEWSAGPRWPRAWVSGMTSDDRWAALGHRIFHGTSAGWSAVDGWQSLPEVQALTRSWPIGPIRTGVTGELWAMVGPDVLLHWNRGAWAATPVIPPSGSYYNSFSDLWVEPGGGAWLGGAVFPTSGGGIVNAAVLLHFDGAGWTSFDPGFFSVAFLWGDRGGGVWLGVSGQVQFPLNRYDPSTRTLTAFPRIGDWSYPGGISAIWGTSPDDLWVAGDNLAAWDGATWAVDSSLPTDMRARLRSPVLTGDAASLWLVNAGGPVLFRASVVAPPN